MLEALRRYVTLEMNDGVRSDGKFLRFSIEEAFPGGFVLRRGDSAVLLMVRA